MSSGPFPAKQLTVPHDCQCDLPHDQHTERVGEAAEEVSGGQHGSQCPRGRTARWAVPAPPGAQRPRLGPFRPEGTRRPGAGSSRRPLSTHPRAGADHAEGEACGTPEAALATGAGPAPGLPGPRRPRPRALRTRGRHIDGGFPGEVLAVSSLPLGKSSCRSPLFRVSSW